MFGVTAVSRIGRLPIAVPQGVAVTIKEGQVSMKGPKGELLRTFNKDMGIALNDNVLTVSRPDDDRNNRSLHGTTRSLLANMVEGVSKGYEKALELVGVGYRAAKQGKKLVLSVGFSHPVEMEPEEGLEIEVPSQTKIIVKGADKQRVGELAANIRAVRPP